MKNLLGLLAKTNLTILISLRLLALAGIAIVLTPRAALADEGVHFKATFAVAFTATANTSGASFCGGAPYPVAIEAHGVSDNLFGGVLVEVQKTLAVPGNMYGCLTMTAANGDVLHATYDGTILAPNANNFSYFSGILTITGGTGRFQGVSGTASFTAWASFLYPSISFLGGSALPVQGVAFYCVDGTVLLPQQW
jgi:hypothetical protein